MTVKINYIKKITNKFSANVVFFTNEKFSIYHLKNMSQTLSLIT